ncbi:hypothetical protein FHX61_004524 [Cupriavidus alkaliphilus]|uniref:Uncharacterized protein n=1 Tax=Cupriavidus alkaliphilus TaxID=942866 RepID=A0A7W4VEX5_9BURK|nr:hypothetical protein [Cupriavidus alkaliphilus]
MELFELGFDRGQIRVNGLIEQARLLGIELLAALTEFQALEYRDLVRELVDTRLAVTQLTIFLTDLCDQLSSQCPKLFRAEVVEVCWRVHMASLPEPNPPWNRNCLRPGERPYTTQIA